MLQATQNKLVPILQLDSSLDVDKNNDKENENNENSLDDSKEEEIVFPAESKRSFNSAKLKEVIIPVYIKRKTRRRNIPSVFTR